MGQIRLVEPHHSGHGAAPGSVKTTQGTAHNHGAGLVHGLDQAHGFSHLLNPSPGIPDLMAAAAGTGPMLHVAQIPPYAVQSSWSGSCTECCAHPGQTMLHTQLLGDECCTQCLLQLVYTALTDTV